MRRLQIKRVLRGFGCGLLVFLVVGCASTRFPAKGVIAQAVEASAAWKHVQSKDSSRAMWFVERKDGRMPVIFVGFDMDTHISRSATLRVLPNGSVEREVIRANGDILWVAED